MQRIRQPLHQRPMRLAQRILHASNLALEIAVAYVRNAIELALHVLHAGLQPRKLLLFEVVVARLGAAVVVGDFAEEVVHRVVHLLEAGEQVLKLGLRDGVVTGAVGGWRRVA